jgi:hypothetical protein
MNGLPAGGSAGGSQAVRSQREDGTWMNGGWKPDGPRLAARH